MILESILRHKEKEVRGAKARKPLKKLKEEVSRLPKKKAAFLKSLKKKGVMAVIAEIKRKSPSKGVLKRDFDAAQIAEGYERAGASALSVLTDKKFFGSSTRVLKEIRAVTGLPILRKDFVIDEYQIWESRLMGADCVLLIASALSATQIGKFSRLAARLGLDALVEVHTDSDAQKAVQAQARFVGINNRDLRTFRVDLAHTKHLVPCFKKNVFLVAESGVQNAKDLIYLRACGAKAALVGESLMRTKDPAATLKNLLAEFSRG